MQKMHLFFIIGRFNFYIDLIGKTDDWQQITPPLFNTPFIRAIRLYHSYLPISDFGQTRLIDPDIGIITDFIRAQ